MGNVKISAKPKYTKNYITINIPCKPEFSVFGRTLAGIREIPCSEIEEKPDERFSLEIPENIDAIANNAFSCLMALQNVCFKHRPYYLGSSIFFGCTGLETAVLAEGTEKIPLETFSGCENLRMVRIPDSVKRINMDAFKNCSSLKQITLPPALEVIEATAFWGCCSLEKITLPDTLTALDDEAFANCVSLKQVRLPASLKKIGVGAFQNCVNLRSIVIPEGVKSLPVGVFAGCRNLTQVVLPASMQYISPYAFYNCDMLSSVEGTNVERFERALECTPFWWKNCLYSQKPSRFPMELLYLYTDSVPGTMLMAMGYTGFDIDKAYSFSLTDYPGIIEVHAHWMNSGYPKSAEEEIFLIDDDLKPIPDIRKLVTEDEYFSTLF